MSLLKKDQQHLLAAIGYSELGMLNEALEELNSVQTSHKKSAEMLGLKLAILQNHEQWPEASTVAQQLIKLNEKQPDWWIALAYAKRRSENLPTAQTVLAEAILRFPKNALIHYNLGCYASQLGQLEEAIRLVKISFQLDSKYKKIAKSDPDLIPIKNQIKKLVSPSTKKRRNLATP